MTNNLRSNWKQHEPEYQKIYDVIYHKIYRTAYFITKDPYLAQDAAQETLIKGFMQLETLQDKERIVEWFITIATRTSIDVIRKQRNWNGIPVENYYFDQTPDKSSTTIEETVEKRMLKEEIMKQIFSLQKEQKEILILKYMHGFKDKEISERLLIKEGTVKSKIHRAKKALRTKIEKDTSYLKTMVSK